MTRITLPTVPIPPTTKISLSTTKAKEKNQSRRVESEKEDGRSLEWDKRVFIVLEKRKKLSLSNSPSLSLFQPMQHRLMDSFKLKYVTKGKLITHTQGAKGWRTIFPLKPHALILFNHFYLFSRNTKISPIYYFGPPWIFLIGPQIFPISLSIISHHFSK